MPERWEYCHLVLEIHNTTKGRQWCWKSAQGLYTLEDGLDELGQLGWELVSLNIEQTRHIESNRNIRNETLAEYPFTRSVASLQRAVLKRRLA